MSTNETLYLTVFVMHNQQTLLGYTRSNADDCFDRARTRTSERVFFPHYVSDQFWQDGALAASIFNVTCIAETDSDGWTLAPEVNINLAHVVLVRTIPNVVIPFKIRNGKYLLKTANNV